MPAIKIVLKGPTTNCKCVAPQKAKGERYLHFAQPGNICAHGGGDTLSNSLYLQYSRVECSPYLTSQHCQQCLKLEEDNVGWEHPDWYKVVFVDEKKFILDGHNDLRSYWRVLRKEPEILSTRLQGGCSIIVWAAIPYAGAL